MSLGKLNQAAQAYQQAAQEHAAQANAQHQAAQQAVNGAQPVPGNDPETYANTPPDQQNSIHLKPKQGGVKKLPPGVKGKK